MAEVSSQVGEEWGFLSGSVVKNPPANVGDVGSIPGSGRSPGEGNGNPLAILAWEIPRREKPGGLQSMGLQRVGHDLATKQQAEAVEAHSPGWGLGFLTQGPQATQSTCHSPPRLRAHPRSLMR